MSLLYTYGTLRKGYQNEPLLADQKYIGKAVTVDAGFLLYEVRGNYTFPALVQSKTGEGYQVFGELYDVSEKCLAYLDRIEGVAVGLYARTPIKVLVEDGRCEEGVIAYTFQRDTGDYKPIGQVWPISELSRYRLVGHRFEEEEKEIEVEGVALYNTHQNRWVTGVSESEAELRKRCHANRVRYGVKPDSEESWSSKWFEARPRKVTKDIMVCRIKTGESTSPDFNDRNSLAVWAADNLKFFGGSTGEAGTWRKVIAEVAPKIDED